METITNTKTGFDLLKIRRQFPTLSQKVNNHPLVYFDNAATSQKPEPVIEALNTYYRDYNANIHRGIHALAEEATSAFEETRNAVKSFLNAAHREEIIFTPGTTGSINLVAATWGRHNLKKGDEVIVSTMEHHSNIVPWQLVCEEKQASLKVIPVSGEGVLDMEAFKKLLNPRTKVVSVTHVSNALGTINPVEEIIRLAHKAGAVVLIDGAQSTVHLQIDVQKMDCDFFTFSIHKVYGPTGCGVLYGKKELLEAMPPYMGGGEMIDQVTFEKTTYNELPYKFEAGTPNIGDVIAFRTSIGFLNGIDREAVVAHEDDVMHYCQQQLGGIDGIRLIGTAPHKTGVVSFLINGAHPSDVGELLDQQGIAVRTGHHCTQPLMDRLGISGTVRASFAMYNTREEVDIFIKAVLKTKKMLVG